MKFVRVARFLLLALGVAIAVAGIQRVWKIAPRGMTFCHPEATWCEPGPLIGTLTEDGPTDGEYQFVENTGRALIEDVSPDTLLKRRMAADLPDLPELHYTARELKNAALPEVFTQTLAMLFRRTLVCNDRRLRCLGERRRRSLGSLLRFF